MDFLAVDEDAAKVVATKAKARVRRKERQKESQTTVERKMAKKGKGINVVYDLSMVIGAGSVTTG